LVEGEEAAFGDAVLAEAIEVERGPAVFDAVAESCAVGERGHMVAVADEQFARVQAQGAGGLVAAAEVLEDGVDACVSAADGVVARDRPKSATSPPNGNHSPMRPSRDRSGPSAAPTMRCRHDQQLHESTRRRRQRDPAHSR
jgi:hypothetical protein